VQELVFVRDYISANHEFAAEEPDVHQVELYFRCTIADEAVPINGSAPDAWQTGIDWLEVARLAEYRLYPKILSQVVPTLAPSASIYIGDVN
jgi:8-oxo-dGTP diphosphatase